MNIETTILSLLTNTRTAEETINTYCVWVNKNIPFTFYKNGVNYAKTGDVINLIDPRKINSFRSTRSTHKSFFLQLGSLWITDTSMRREIYRDCRLLNTWIHNSNSLAALLLMYQPTFNAFVGNTNIRLAPKYSISYLDNVINQPILLQGVA